MSGACMFVVRPVPGATRQDFVTSATEMATLLGCSVWCDWHGFAELVINPHSEVFTNLATLQRTIDNNAKKTGPRPRLAGRQDIEDLESSLQNQVDALAALKDLGDHNK